MVSVKKEGVHMDRQSAHAYSGKLDTPSNLTLIAIIYYPISRITTPTTHLMIRAQAFPVEQDPSWDGRCGKLGRAKKRKNAFLDLEPNWAG